MEKETFFVNHCELTSTANLLIITHEFFIVFLGLYKNPTYICDIEKWMFDFMEHAFFRRQFRLADGCIF